MTTSNESLKKLQLLQNSVHKSMFFAKWEFHMIGIINVDSMLVSSMKLVSFICMSEDVSTLSFSLWQFEEITCPMRYEEAANIPMSYAE